MLTDKLNLVDLPGEVVVCNHWLSIERKNVYVFVGNRTVKEDTYRDAKTAEVHVINETIHPDDTVEVLIHKFLGYALQHKVRASDLYGWYTRELHEHDVIDLMNIAYDRRATMPTDELTDLFKVNFRKRVRLTKDSLYDKASAIEMIAEKKIYGRIMALGVEFRYPTSERIMPVAPWPFDQARMEQDEARRIRDPHRILANLLSSDKVFNFVERSVLKNPVYYDSPQDQGKGNTEKQFFEETVKRMDNLLEDVAEQIEDVVVTKDVNHRVEKLIFRAFPSGNAPLHIDIGLAFKKLETSSDVPLICHQATNTNVYKMDRKVMKSLSGEERAPVKTVIKEVTKQELDRRDKGLRRKGEHLICYCVYRDFHFRVVINSNGSYRVFYRFKRLDQEGFAHLNKSFEVVGRIVKMLDETGTSMFMLSPEVNIFDHERIEIIEQITFTKVLSSRRLVSEDTMFANMRALPALFGEIEDKPDLLRYKRVDRFRNVNAIAYFVHNHINLSAESLLRRVMAEFGMSAEDAEKEIENARYDVNAPGIQRRGGSIFALRKYNAGLLLRVTRVDNFTLKVRVINSANPTYTSNAIRALMYCATNKKLKQKNVPKTSETTDPTTIRKRDVSYTNLYETSLETQNDLMDDDMRDFLQESLSDIDLGFDASSDFNEENDVDDFEEERGSPIAEDVDEETPSTTEAFDDSEEDDVKRYTNFVLAKLIEADKDLFTWDNKKYPNYATKCGAVNFRQPIVITKEEKMRIDKEHPNSYTGYVKTGSTEEKREKYFYICPTIWCKLGRYSLSREEYEKNGQKCGAPHFEKPLLFPPPNKPNYFMNKKGEEIHVPRFLKESMHPNKLLMPCCAKTSKDALYGAEKEPTEEVATNDFLKYIAGIAHDKPLALDKMGGITKELARVLNTHPHIGPISKNTACVVRTGVDAIGGHSFARCVEAILQMDNLYQTLADKMEVWHYVAMNQGNTMRLFSDPKDAERLFAETKARTAFVSYLSANVEYVRMFGLQATLKAIQKYDGMLPEDHPQRVAATREFVIYCSFVRFKRYLLDDRFSKTEHDLLHLAHFDFVNPNRIGIFVVSEKTETQTHMLYPRYFDMHHVFADRRQFGVCVKVDHTFEFLQGVFGLSERTTRFSSKPSLLKQMNVGHLLRAIPRANRPKIPEDTTLIVGHDARVRGYTSEQNEPVMLESPSELRFETDTVGRRLIYDTELEGASDVDAQIFASIPALPTEAYGKSSYDVAIRVLKKRELREDMEMVRHVLNPMTTSDKLEVIEDLLRSNKTSLPSDKRELRAVCRDLLLKTPGYIVREYENRTRTMGPNVVVLGREEVVRGALMKQYERALNMYQIWDSSAADNFIELDSVMISSFDKSVRRPNEVGKTIAWTNQYVPLDVARIRDLMPKLLVHDSEITWDEMVRVFGKGKVSADTFTEAYLSHMNDMFVNDPKGFRELLQKNPNMSEHEKVDKKRPMDDLRKIVTSGNFYIGTFDIDFIANYFEVPILLLQRGGSQIGNGIDFKGDCKSDNVFVLQATNVDKSRPKRHMFRFVVYEKGVLDVPLLAINKKVRESQNMCQ